MSSFRGTMAFRMPSCFSSSASIMRPLSASSRARMSPTLRCSNQVPVTDARPRLTSGCPINVPGWPMRLSQSSAIWKPPPAATPLIAATRGFWKRSRARKKSSNSSTHGVSSFQPWASLRSWPAQKASPRPVITAAVTRGSSFARPSSAPISPRIARVKAFSRPSFSISMMAMPWSWRWLIWPMVLLLCLGLEIEAALIEDERHVHQDVEHAGDRVGFEVTEALVAGELRLGEQHRNADREQERRLLVENEHVVHERRQALAHGDGDQHQVPHRECREAEGGGGIAQAGRNSHQRAAIDFRAVDRIDQPEHQDADGEARQEDADPGQGVEAEVEKHQDRNAAQDLHDHAHGVMADTTGTHLRDGDQQASHQGDRRAGDGDEERHQHAEHQLWHDAGSVGPIPGHGAQVMVAAPAISGRASRSGRIGHWSDPR